MPKLLFIHRDSTSASLSGSNDEREKSLINSHVQTHRNHLKRTHLKSKPTSSRPKFLEFQRKTELKAFNGSVISSIDSNKENEGPEKLLSTSTEDGQDVKDKQLEEDFRLSNYPSYNDDWTVSIVPTGSQRLLDVRQHMHTFYSQKGLLRHLAPVAAQHPGLLTSLAYIACSNLDALKNQDEAPSSLITKGKAVCAINDNLSKSGEATSVANILAVAALASAVNIYDTGIGKEYLLHRKGLESMAAARVKSESSAQPTTVAEKLFNRLIGLHRYILPCIYNLELPLPEYPAADYGYDDETVSVDEPSARREMISESPFYCQSPDYRYLQTSTYSDPRTMQVLRDIRDYYAVLAEERAATAPEMNNVLIKRLTLREQVLKHPSVHMASSGPERSKAKTDGDYVFECIRLTALVLIHLSDTCSPIRAAFALTTTTINNGQLTVKEKPLKQLEISTPLCRPETQSASPINSPSPSQLILHLAYNLQKGPNPVIGWGSAMEGVLYWITTIGTAVARGRPEYRLFSSLNAKTISDMACSSDGRMWDEGFVPIQNFISFQQMCLNREITMLVEVE